MKAIDNLLNRITMYRLMLYYLILLLSVAIVESAVGILGYDPFALLFTVAFLLAACAITNWIFAKIWQVPANAESTYISALILALIITPFQSRGDLGLLVWASVWAMASKYVLAIDQKHIFNPVAFAVALTYLTINQSASWWVGDAPMLPFVLLGGILVVRKIARSGMVWAFLLTVAVTVILGSVLSRQDLGAALQQTVLYSPLFFFAFVMLTEPLTTPPTQGRRLVYGVLVGILYSPQFHIGAFYLTPELALVLGNVYSYLASPKQTLVLRLKHKIQLAPDVYDFVFASPHKLAFAPGQYMEWTLGHADPDSRGNRRYFTLASSPTEDQVRLGVRFYPKPSSFKETLLALPPESEIVATHLAGDFTLPRHPHQKCVLIAGGIGITPFRSMLKYLLDNHLKRPVVLFYANRTAAEIVYRNVLDRAQRELGVPIVYTLTDPSQVPPLWRGKVGRITPEMIREAVPDFAKCLFYISGPRGMVDSAKEMLHALGVKDRQIKTDYFSGLA